MVTANQTFRGKANAGPATTPDITNLVSPATPGTEFSHTFANGTKKFIIRNRGNVKIKYAYTASESGSNYVTIPGNASKSEDNVYLNGITIYMQTTAASQTIEIEEWT